MAPDLRSHNEERREVDPAMNIPFGNQEHDARIMRTSSPRAEAATENSPVKLSYSCAKAAADTKRGRTSSWEQIPNPTFPTTDAHDCLYVERLFKAMLPLRHTLLGILQICSSLPAHPIFPSHAVSRYHYGEAWKRVGCKTPKRGHKR